MTTRVLGTDDLDLYRALRLEALLTDPTQFCSTHEREAAFDDATMAARMTSYDGRPGVVLVDDQPAPCGMVGVGVETTGRAMVWGMWVRPATRRSGLGRALIEAAVGWARSQDLPAVDLWVVVGNGAAIALYERCGFVATGAADVVPGRPGVAEVEMRRVLR